MQIIGNTLLKQIYQKQHHDEQWAEVSATQPALFLESGNLLKSKFVSVIVDNKRIKLKRLSLLGLNFYW